MRKIIQIQPSPQQVLDQTTGAYLTTPITTALCDDGTYWRLMANGWIKFPDIPQDEVMFGGAGESNSNSINHGWINVKDELPASETEVLGLCNILGMQVILIVYKECYDDECWFRSVGANGVDTENDVEVTHWQPLPAILKGVK